MTLLREIWIEIFLLTGSLNYRKVCKLWSNIYDVKRMHIEELKAPVRSIDTSFVREILLGCKSEKKYKYLFSLDKPFKRLGRIK